MLMNKQQVYRLEPINVCWIDMLISNINDICNLLQSPKTYVKKVV